MPPILISGIILSFYGFYQKFALGGSVPSLMNNPNIFAGYFSGVICLLFGFTIQKLNKCSADIPTIKADGQNYKNRTNVREMFHNKNAYLFLLFIFLTALFFSGSIAGYLSVAFGIAVFLYLKKIRISKKYLIFIVGIIVFLIVIKLSEKESFNRVIWWFTTGKMILANPISGVGLGVFADAYQKYKLSGLNSIYAHNYFLQIVSEIGIFGFAAFVWFLIKIFMTEKTSKNIPFFAAISAMLFHGIFDYALLIPANSILFWAMLGYCSKEEKFIQIFPTQNQKIIFRWISVFIVSAMIYSQIMIFLASRETARGKYFIDENRYDIAKNHLINAIKYDDKNPQTYFFLSGVYQQYYRITSYKSYLYEAELELLKAAKFQKYNPQIYFDLYNIYYFRGDIKNALIFMKKTLEVSPKSIYYEKCYETLLKEIYKNEKPK